jgi:ABC-2 type transport system permease protein
LRAAHALSGLLALAERECVRFWRQRGRLVSAVVRPSLWLLVFAAGFQSVLGVSRAPPYEGAVLYEVYVVPGLVGIVLLFNGMQSSLSMVYDREMGMMRLLLTAPLPRWYLLACKLVAGTLLSILQAYAFLAVCAVFGVDVPWLGWITVAPAMVLVGLMLGAIGLVLSVYVEQLENFAGTMNFVIFPMFFVSSALYPIERFLDSGAAAVYWAAWLNPFTYGVELMRFALYGRLEPASLAVVLACLLGFFLAAVRGYDPQRGLAGRGGPPRGG